MSTISVSLPSDGTTATTSQYNTPITTIVNAINGGLDTNNLSANAAIATGQLADDSVTYAKVANGFCVQQVSALYSAVGTGTTLIPNDDTIPQNTEGTEFMTLAITPKATTNTLEICVSINLSHSATASFLFATLFQDSTADAIAAGSALASTATGTDQITFYHTMAAGTTSSTTFKVRAGSSAAGTTTFNGSSGARRFGGITTSSIIIREYTA